MKRRDLSAVFSKQRSRTALKVLALVCGAGFLVWRFASPAGSPVADVADPEIPTYEPVAAGAHVGERARVCGEVAGARYVRTIEGRPTFLNFVRPHPDAAFTAVIWGEHRTAFRAAPEDLYRGRRVCVAGTIRRHEGRPQIVVTSPAQVALEEELR